MTEPRIIAECQDYAQLVSAVRARIRALGIAHETLDHIAGLQQGYSSKLMSSPPLKKFGNVSLGCVLGALGCKLVLVEDPEALARVQSRLVKRDDSKVRTGATEFRVSHRFLSKIGRLGGFRHAEVRRLKERRRKRNRRYYNANRGRNVAIREARVEI